MKRFAAAALACAVFFTSAQAPAPAPAPAAHRTRPPVDTDEGGLWAISDRTEAEARGSGELIQDAALTTYIRGIACRVAAEYCGDLRVYLMARPYFNASMAPNGYMEVWSGLLLRAEDEAQLSFVLGHEATHYVERHSLEMLRAQRNRSTGLMLFSIATAIAGVGIIGNIAYLGTIASLFGFSREAETEADREGFTRAVAAGYDPQSGAKLWNNLIAETQASDFPAVRRRATHGSIFASHPVTTERVSALTALAANAPQGGRTERTRYRAEIRPFLKPWLRDELRRRDYGQALFLLERLGRDGEDLGIVNYYRGEAFRLRRGDGDLIKAKEAYELSIRSADAPPDAWRELGEIYAREQRAPEAAGMLRAYISRAPNAQDKLIVEQRIRILEGGQ
ncbi:MAG: M48 family metalloprotease [Caulobacterales bacterium]